VLDIEMLMVVKFANIDGLGPSSIVSLWEIFYLLYMFLVF